MSRRADAADLGTHLTYTKATGRCTDCHVSFINIVRGHIVRRDGAIFTVCEDCCPGCPS